MTFVRIRMNKDMTESELISELMPLVKRIASHLIRKLPGSIRYDDIVSAGMVGLLEACKKFSADRCDSFVGYATMRIRGAMLDELRRGDIMSQEMRTLSRRLEHVIQDLESRLGRTPQSSEIAQAMGMSEEDYLNEAENLAQVQLISFDPQDHTMQRLKSADQPELETEMSELKGHLALALNQLPEREKLILSLYYEQELTLKEIGEVMDLTPARVCQLHAQAIHRLKSWIQTEPAVKSIEHVKILPMSRDVYSLNQHTSLKKGKNYGKRNV